MATRRTRRRDSLGARDGDGSCSKLKGRAHFSAESAPGRGPGPRQAGVEEALDLLEFSNKKAAHIIKKVLESAIANAENNEGADVDELTVSSIFVDEGMTMKRLRPRAKGRADRILKRTSHITGESGRTKLKVKLMGQKVHPTGIRLGIVKDHSSVWYADKQELRELPD